ncbi:MAG TPA: hypothetical protein VIX12_00115, partial [Candidatus Binataceae bacterium]
MEVRGGCRQPGTRKVVPGIQIERHAWVIHVYIRHSRWVRIHDKAGTLAFGRVREFAENLASKQN